MGGARICGGYADVQACGHVDMRERARICGRADVQTCGRARICLGATDELSVARERAGDVCADDMCARTCGRARVEDRREWRIMAYTSAELTA